jgi:hypothetical protein
LPGAAILHVEEPVARWTQHHGAPTVAPRHVGQDDLVDVVVIEQVVRASYGPHAASALAEGLYSLSPVMCIVRVLSADPHTGVVANAVIQAIISLMMLVPSWTRRARNHVAMAYTWTDSKQMMNEE